MQNYNDLVLNQSNKKDTDDVDLCKKQQGLLGLTLLRYSSVSLTQIDSSTL